MDPLLKASYGLSIYESANSQPIPDNAWEFQIRKCVLVNYKRCLCSMQVLKQKLERD
jgi:hypothetical protein